MIDIKNLYHVNKILRKELSNNIKDCDTNRTQFHRLCEIVGSLQILIKEVEKDGRSVSKAC